METDVADHVTNQTRDKSHSREAHHRQILIFFVASTAQASIDAASSNDAVSLVHLPARSSLSANDTLNKLRVANGWTTHGYAVTPLILRRPISSISTLPQAVSNVIAPSFTVVLSYHRPLCLSQTTWISAIRVYNHHQRVFLCVTLQEPLMINSLVLLTRTMFAEISTGMFLLSFVKHAASETICSTSLIARGGFLHLQL